MDHRLSSEAFNQKYSIHESCVSDGSQQPGARVRRQRGSEPCSGPGSQRVNEPCPGSQPANPERIYVLRNCDLSPDYTVSPCQENQCPMSYYSCSGSCASRSINSSGSCPNRSINYTGPGTSRSINSSGPCSTQSAEYPFQENICGEKMKPKKPQRPLPDQKQQQAKRRTGGNNEICPLCGQLEIIQAGQNMCCQCNERIHAAVNNYMQGQYDGAKEKPVFSCQNASQPVNGQWQQPNIITTGDPNPNLNVIVLQDCQNKQELFDQLTMAMNLNAGQQNNNYYQNNASKCQNTKANNYQNSNTNNYQNNPANSYHNPTNNYQNNPTNNYQNNPLNNYQNNPPACYNEFLDYGRSCEHPEPYDCRYDVSPGQCRYKEGGYDDFRCSSRTPCSNSFDCHPREAQSYDSFLDKDADPCCGCTCTCNCEFCRKGFESKEKLAMLIAQALEIFIQGYQAKNDKKPVKKTNKKKSPRDRRKSAGSAEVQPEVATRWELMPPKLRRAAAESRSSDRSSYPRKRAHPPPPPEIHVFTQIHEPQPAKEERQAPKKSNSFVNAKANSQVNLHRFCAKQKAAKEPSNETTNVEQETSNSPLFFLPNNGDELRSFGGAGGAAWARSCEKCGGGGGDSRRRRRARRRGRYQNRHHSMEWHQQCQRENEDRRWQRGCNTTGGGKNSSVLLGLSPIAHYRPGMMKFPVNYLLAGTNYRRSLVRTAAGVTLHQKPYMDKDEVKDLPSFPRQKESSHLDCRMPPPAKKWL